MGLAMKLRDYQRETMDALRLSMRTHRRSLLVSPTGSGKTVMFVFMASRAAARGNQVLILVHRMEIMEQISKTLNDFGIEHAVNEPWNNAAVHLMMVIKAGKRVNDIPIPDLIIIDEAHHATKSSSYAHILDAHPEAKVVGVTATPERLDGAGLCDSFDTIVEGPSVGELIGLEWLSDFRLLVPTTLDTSKASSRGGDYVRSQLAELTEQSGIVGDAVKHYLKLCPKSRAIAFCVHRQHARSVCERFVAAGVAAEVLDGSAELRNERSAIVNRFRTSRTKVLVTVDLISEGFDIPAAEVAILLRKTKSLSLYLQQVGRVLRPSPNKKHAIILDHVGNSLVHGFPDDDREWSLDARKRRRKKDSCQSTESVHVCVSCFSAYDPRKSAVCPWCGHQREQRKVVESDGELVEATKTKRAFTHKEFLRRQARSRTVEEITELAKKQGYRRPHLYARAVMRKRMEKRRNHWTNRERV